MMKHRESELKDEEGWQNQFEFCVNLLMLLNKWVFWRMASTHR